MYESYDLEEKVVIVSFSLPYKCRNWDPNSPGPFLKLPRVNGKSKCTVRHDHFLASILLTVLYLIFHLVSKCFYQQVLWRHQRILMSAVLCSVTQSCLTLCDPVDCSLPGSSVQGILQTRILEWVAMPSSGSLPNPGMEPAFLMLPALAGGFFTTSATWEEVILMSSVSNRSLIRNTAKFIWY